MKTIEEFKAEQEAAATKALAAHERKLGIAEAFVKAGLPIPEYMGSHIFGMLHVAYWNKHYDNPRSMGQAIDLFETFEKAGVVMPLHYMKDDMFTTLAPALWLKDKKKYKKDSYRSAGYACKLGVTYNKDGGHVEAKLEFYALIGGNKFNVTINFGTGYIGTCPALRPETSWNSTRTGEAGKLVKVSHNPIANSFSDHCVNFSYGGSNSGDLAGADHRYLFLSDTDNDEPSVCGYAIERLRLLAEEVKA